jgi:mono/diheme cytochrome c family protein
MNQTKKSNAPWSKIVLGLVLVFGALIAFTAWYKFFREVPQPEFATPEERFKYGSLGAEDSSGIPYWIFLVLPRMFPEYLPGPGGYAALGIAWEEGRDVPVGFAKKVVGFERVTNNCAVCHAAVYRGKEDETPHIVVGAPGHTTDVQGFFRFLTDCANDPRFNADNLLREIATVTKLSWLDRVLYRFLIIPILKKRIVEQGENFAWMNREGLPDWARGRDDPMNLTKYFMLRMAEDGSFGPADMPSIWNLNKYQRHMALNWDGATTVARSVIIDSALGLGASPKPPFLEHVKWLQDYLGALPAPRYPFAIDTALAAQGKSLFDAHCAQCHAGPRTGISVPIEEVGTDRERLATWSKEAAIQANKKVKSMGIERDPMVEETLTGYIAVHLDGVWLRAPYLHNGSVPTLRDLLEPADKRPQIFYRGYDVYDPTSLGFVSQGENAQRVGSRIDVHTRGNGNQGHAYGTTLKPAEKNALLEYLKTL